MSGRRTLATLATIGCATVALLASTASAIPPAGASALEAPRQPETAGRQILVMLKMPPEHYRPGSEYGSAGGYGDLGAKQARRRLAARLAHDQGLVLVDNWPMPVLGIDCVIMSVPGTEPLDAVIKRIEHAPGVAWSQPVNEFTAQGMGSPNDRLFLAQPAAEQWQLIGLHALSTGRGVKIAVIDSMIDADHPDLKGRVTTQRDFVGGSPSAPEEHGTGIAGIIGARAGNGLGIVGIAPGAQLMGLRACWQRSATLTVCDSLSLARALAFAVENGAQIVNMSLSGPDDALITRLIQAGLARNIAFVAAIDPRSGTGFPASIPGVVGVSQDGLATAKPGVYNAPGRDVPTTEPGGKWYLVSGNSYAAAHVSGLLALARQLDARPRGHVLVAARADGGEIDACGTLLRAARQGGHGCASPH